MNKYKEFLVIFGALIGVVLFLFPEISFCPKILILLLFSILFFRKKVQSFFYSLFLKLRIKKEVFFDDSFRTWKLNPWGTNYCSVKGDGLHFQGVGSNDEDGANFLLINKLKKGEEYLIECFSSSTPNTTGQIKIWCHNNLKRNDENYNSIESKAVTPSIDGEKISLIFKAKNNNDIKIHIQYYIGNGRIVIKWVKVSQLK